MMGVRKCTCCIFILLLSIELSFSSKNTHSGRLKRNTARHGGASKDREHFKHSKNTYNIIDVDYIDTTDTDTETTQESKPTTLITPVIYNTSDANKDKKTTIVLVPDSNNFTTSIDLKDNHTQDTLDSAMIHNTSDKNKHVTIAMIPVPNSNNTTASVNLKDNHTQVTVDTAMTHNTSDNNKDETKTNSPVPDPNNITTSVDSKDNQTQVTLDSAVNYNKNDDNKDGTTSMTPVPNFVISTENQTTGTVSSVNNIDKTSTKVSDFKYATSSIITKERYTTVTPISYDIYTEKNITDLIHNTSVVNVTKPALKVHSWLFFGIIGFILLLCVCLLIIWFRVRYHRNECKYGIVPTATPEIHCT